MSKTISLREIISRVKKYLKQSGYLMNILSEYIIISQLWSEDDKVNIIAWIPDLDNEKGLKYVKKKITYDLKKDEVIEIRDLENEAREK